LGAAAVLAVAGACKRGGPPQAPPPPEGAVVQVEPHRLPPSFEIAGEVYPSRRVEVRARVDGVIESRPFTEGTTVKPGQVLYRLDGVRPEEAYRRARARHQDAKPPLAPRGAAGQAERRRATGRGQRAGRHGIGRGRSGRSEEESGRRDRAR